jgi:F-type H+-transporting ATPase subunit delta
MVDGSLARRYARALLDIGRERGNVDALGADLGRFLEVGRIGGLLETLANPVYTQVERRRVLEAVLAKMTLTPVAANFLRLVLDKDRMAAFPDIVRAYGALADEHAGRVRATVTTAAPVSDAHRAALTSALAASTGKQVVLTAVVDPTLLGGMTVRVGSKLIDASLKSRLEALQLSLLHPSAAQA